MEGKTDRRACFKTVIAYLHGDDVNFFEGRVDGTILNAPCGEGGFGYDPLFMPEGYDRSFAEMSADEKNAISHRGRAVRKLVEFLS